ncbi:hypothetical protein TeGR_g8423, partial [Tetraparma gracilis]
PVLEVLQIVVNCIGYAKTKKFKDGDAGKDIGYNEKGWYAVRPKLGLRCPWAGAAASPTSV